MPSSEQDTPGWVEAWERSKRMQRDLRLERLAKLEQTVRALGDIEPSTWGRENLAISEVVQAARDLVAPDPEECPAPFREWRCRLPKGHPGPCEDA